MKSDCPNPRVEREFIGQCNLCQRDGHRAKDCPEKPAVVCRNCNAEGTYILIDTFNNMS